MAPLTFGRLLDRLTRLFDAVPDQFPGENDGPRSHNVRSALKAGMVSAQAGLEGDQTVLSPGQLKHWINDKIAAIHERLDREAVVSPSSSFFEAMGGERGSEDQYQEDSGFLENSSSVCGASAVVENLEHTIIESIEPILPRSNSSKENTNRKSKYPATHAPVPPRKTSAVIKRRIRAPTPDAGIKKPAPKRNTRATTRITSPNAQVAITHNVTEQEAAYALLDLFNSRPPNTFAALPALDYAASAAEVFLDGALFAMQNLAHTTSCCTDTAVLMSQFEDYVAVGSGLHEIVESDRDRHADVSASGKSFWDVI